MKLPVNLTSMWQRNRGARTLGDSDHMAHQDLHTQVEAAHREWLAAQQYFQSVSEPDLVDHAIYALEAAQRKYMYLFRQLRDGQDLPPEMES